jgi:glycosyltransferase involved in cell wall biosynthesis
MVTYNHGKFIDQAIESVIAQETTFQYRLFIGEDFSKDNTRERCEYWSALYPDKITLLESKENIGILKNANRVFEACLYSGAEYIALLEGDDFWTDQHKLEKQVSLLKQNPNAAGSYHNTIIEKKDGVTQVMFKKLPLIIGQELAISKYAPFHTSSFIFKAKYYCRPDWFQKIDSIDLALFSLYAQFGDLLGINEVMSHYRQHEGGHTSSAEHQNNFHQRRVLLHRYIKGKIQNNFLWKSDQLIQLHTKKIQNNIPIAPQRVIGFLNPSSGDIDNSRFTQMSLDAEIVPFTLFEKGVNFYNEKTKKFWWNLNGEKWLKRILKKKFPHNIDAFYVQHPRQLEYMHSISSVWKTPIILDYEPCESEYPFSLSKNTVVYGPSDLAKEAFPNSMCLRPLFLKRFQKKKDKIVFFTNQEIPGMSEILKQESAHFELQYNQSDTKELENIVYLASVFCAVVFENDLISSTQLLQLISQGAAIIAPEHAYHFPTLIQHNIVSYQDKLEIPGLIKELFSASEAKQDVQSYIHEKLNLALHCHQINQLIEKII